MSEGSGKSVSPRLAGMRGLEAQVKTCQLCKLAKTRTNAVPGEGYVRADVMFVGEGPGYHEDRQGRPFVGPAGQFLNELLEIAGLSRERVYIANVVKCRPPNNRDPEPDEIAACAPYLERQIALINPKVIVTLGRFSMAKFFPGERVSQIHGTAKTVDGRLCVAMYHPAAGLHQQSLADVIRADFAKLPAFLESTQGTGIVAPAVVEHRIAEAEQAREEVIHTVDPAEPVETASKTATQRHVEVVRETVASYATIAPEMLSLQLPAAIEPAPEMAADATPPKAATPRKNRKKAGSEYKQMSFFDL